MKERKGRTEEQREPFYFDNSGAHLFIARNYLVINGKVDDVIATALSSSLCASASLPSSRWREVPSRWSTLWEYSRG